MDTEEARSLREAEQALVFFSPRTHAKKVRAREGGGGWGVRERGIENKGDMVDEVGEGGETETQRKKGKKKGRE